MTRADLSAARSEIAERRLVVRPPLLETFRSITWKSTAVSCVSWRITVSTARLWSRSGGRLIDSTKPQPRAC